jgi:very-short-patch-repair endonuclease
LEREYRFHHERRWRADFAHVEARVLIEIEGGIWVNGRQKDAAAQDHHLLVAQAAPP